MIALNKDLLRNTFFIENARSLRDGGFITKAQFLSAKAVTPVLRTQNNFLVRIGFLLLGIFLYSSVAGVVSLFGLAIMERQFEAFTFMYGIIGLVGIEFLSRQNYYGYGLDDAFTIVLCTMTAMAFGINTESPTVAFLVLGAMGVFCAIRYVHTVSMLLGLIGITGFFCCLVFDLEIIAALYLPFIGLGLAVAMYMVFRHFNSRSEAYFYQYGLQVLQVFSLILGYTSVNYFVVRELSVEMLHITVDAQHDIPFAAVFYLLTFAIPLLYIFFGLKYKMRALLILGMLTLGCSVLTIRYYYSILPAETALIVAGVLLFALAYACIRKLKGKESGITFERDRHSDKNSLMYAQVILANSQISVKPPVSDSGPMPFGGGGFSGGGSSETY